MGKQYKIYKDSGVEWIGKIPKNWKTQKLGYLGKFTASGIDKKISKEETFVKIINYTDVYKSLNQTIDNSFDFMIVTAKDEKIKEHTVKKGDLIFTPTSENTEDIGISALVIENLENTAFSYHVLRFKFTENIDFNYRKYLCNNHLVLNQFSIRAQGITRYTLRRADFKNTIVLLPSLEEQTQIANYLDYKTSLIDTIITQKEQLIEQLNEQRQAIINEAVTKGLNPNAPLKDSGIEWLGKIPEHWEVKKLKYLGTFQNGVSAAADYFGSGFPFISYGDVYKSEILPDKVNGLANSSIEERERFSVEKGDVFFTRTSETVEEIGITSICLNTVENAVFAGFLIRFRPFKNLFSIEMYNYFLRSFIPRFFFIREMNLVTRASLSQELLKRLPVLIPPVSEQLLISNFLEKEVSNIDSIIEKSIVTIKKLKEYRQSIISEAVTGKIDVRDWKPKTS